MGETPVKTSISKGKADTIAIKFSVSYIRVSSAKQADESKSGIRRQEKQYQKWLKEHPEYSNFDKSEFVDAGVSGRGENVKQGALGLILKKAESGELPAHTCLVVESMSRLTRDQPYDGIGLIRRLWDLGCTIAFTQGKWKGEVLTGRESGIHGRIESALEAASFEWEDKRARVVEHYDERAERIENGDKSDNRSRSGTTARMYPFWLDFDEKIDDFVKILEKVKLVQRIFTMAETMGPGKIAYTLQQEGIKNISTSGKSEFTPTQTIRICILQNRAVLGEKKIRGIIKYDYYPAIITPEQFTAVKDATVKRSTSENLVSNNKMVNLFQGVIYCANCGGRIDVVKKNRDVCKIRGKKNGEKELVTYRQMYCHHGRARTTDCTVNNPAPYIYKSSGLDNELNILKKIQTFRWAEFFTDEKHQGELKIEKDKRTRFLDERNKVKELIEKYNRAESKLFDEGEILSKVQREKRKEAQIKYDELDEKYNRAILDIQNLNRKITGDQAEKDIKKRVEIFIKRDRFITNKRSEFNMWLKQVGISVEVAIGKKLQKYPDNYSFSVGLGMYDFITKEYRGLDQSLDDLVGLGVDVKQVKESEAKSYENYKKQSLELKYDIRFPKPKKEIKKITEEEFSKRIEAKL